MCIPVQMVIAPELLLQARDHKLFKKSVSLDILPTDHAPLTVLSSNGRGG